jgi:hypothetical protein
MAKKKTETKASKNARIKRENESSASLEKWQKEQTQREHTADSAVMLAIDCMTTLCADCDRNLALFFLWGAMQKMERAEGYREALEIAGLGTDKDDKRAADAWREEACDLAERFLAGGEDERLKTGGSTLGFRSLRETETCPKCKGLDCEACNWTGRIVKNA